MCFRAAESGPLLLPKICLDGIAITARAAGAPDADHGHSRTVACEIWYCRTLIRMQAEFLNTLSLRRGHQVGYHGQLRQPEH